MIKELYSHFYSRNVYSQKSLVTDEEKYVIKSHATDERYFYSFKKKKKITDKGIPEVKLLIIKECIWLKSKNH